MIVPVEVAHKGCTTDPITGAEGVAGCELMRIFVDGKDVHPSALVTVKVYVPDVKSEIVVPLPVPDMLFPSGILVRIQFPEAGNPFKTTVPVGDEQVGWVMSPCDGVAGATKALLITKSADDTHVGSTVLRTLIV